MIIKTIIFNLILLYLCIIVMGAINTLVYRIIKNHKIGSLFKCYCENCGKEISFWHKNLPIINYIILKGRTSCCNKKISIIHPITELIGGVTIYSIIKILIV